jgi:aspartyl/asparaginyl beta-hydroxylase (cupin superfamily)
VKKIVTLLLTVGILAALLYFVSWFKWVLLVLVVCGLIDVLRNTGKNASLFKRYFTGNGILTWMLSPFNIFLDLLSLPYINKGIYQLQDLPKGHQAEIQKLIDASQQNDLVGQLKSAAEAQTRSMFFFKWYGANDETIVDIPAFHEKYKYIKTIGVSVFNKKQSTSKHFGPFRATLRVLYNVNNMTGKDAYIEVGDTLHYWSENKLFIFDDTLQHQSFNETDKARYCLFVDILRPSPFAFVMNGVVTGIRFFLKGANAIFYKNWKVIGK